MTGGGGAFMFRHARTEDLAACADIWRSSVDDYSARLGRMPLGPPPASFHDMLAHLLATDPDRFVIVERDDSGAVGFASAIRRAHVWFLAMLFVLPGHQANGLGRALLERVLPAADDDCILSTCTDSVQPISNALYSRYGIVPRMPVLELVGRPERAPLPLLPPGLAARAIGDGGTAVADLGDLDRATIGYARPGDHEYLLRSGRHGFAYLDGRGDLAGYGYVARSGRVGPIAVAREELMAPVLGHLLNAIAPAGAFSAWVPGANGTAVRALLEAGLLIEDYPALLCWTRPYGDLARYIPITLAIL
jgi:GNAT superfamily N-acetyltransferase